jgi:pimeloyl-ACP methyl ester carboxylesterase
VQIEQGSVEVDGDGLFYERAGDGPPVVLLHGGMWDRRMWDDQFEPLAAEHTVVRFDMRGFGRSDTPTKPYTNHGDALAVSRSLKLERPAVLGLSMGGSVALDFAVSFPEELSALVVASCGIGGHSEWSSEVLDAWEREDAAVEAGDIQGALDGQVDFWTPPSGDADTDRRLRDIAFDNVRVYEIPDELSSRAEPPVIGRLREIPVPTLVVVGERDVSDIVRMGDRMADEIPDARKVVIPEADHLPNARDSVRFNREVLSFLRDAVRRDPGGS